MAYLIKPDATDRINQSQSVLKQNFQEISNLISVNHGDFGAADAGKHTFLQMPEQLAAPSTSANEMGVFTKEGAKSGVSELFVVRESNGAVLNLTEQIATSPGYCWLAGGILMKWGYDTATSGAFKQITFPTAANIPVFSTTPFHLSVTTTFQTGSGVDTSSPRSSVACSGPDSAHPVTTTTFYVYQQRISGTPSNVVFFWFALGT